MLRRLFAHNLFLRVPGPEFIRIAGRSMASTRYIVQFTRLIAPWFLIASFGMLLMALGFWGVLFLPIFVLGYFQFSLHSVRSGGPGFVSVIALGGLLLLVTPDAPVWVSRFISTFALALWCNRISWWFADWSLTKNVRLVQLFNQQQQGGGNESETHVEEAEVVSITDVIG